MIDFVEIMKTGLFELRYERVGNEEKITITPKENDWLEDLVSPDIESLKKSLDGSWENDIPWGEIPSRYSYVAMDGDCNDWYAFTEKPKILKSFKQWEQWDSTGKIRDLDDIQMPTPPHWTESLVRRKS